MKHLSQRHVEVRRPDRWPTDIDLVRCRTRRGSCFVCTATVAVACAVAAGPVALGHEDSTAGYTSSFDEHMAAGSEFRGRGLHTDALYAYQKAARLADTPRQVRSAKGGVALARYDLGEACEAAAEFRELAAESPASPESTGFQHAYRSRLAERGREPDAAWLNCRLRNAVRDGNEPLVAELIDQGADVGQRTPKGRTLLHEAASRKSPGIAALLLEHDAPADADAAGWTPLHYALAERIDADELALDPPREIVRLLLDRGARVDAGTDVVGWTPLHLAAGQNDAELIVELIDRGADPNARRRVGGWTPLHIAERVENPSKDVVDALRFRGAENQSALEEALFTVYFGDTAESWRDLDPLPLPAFNAGGHSVAGSFSAPGAAERIVFETLGRAGGGYSLKAAAVVDREGRVDVLWAASGSSVDFLGLCRDSATDTDVAMFEVRGSYATRSQMRFMHWSASDREMVTAYAPEIVGDGGEEEGDRYSQASPWRTASGRCRWREHKAAAEDFAAALAALKAGEPARFGNERLPSRVVPHRVVESNLAVMRELPPDIATVVEGVTYYDSPDVPTPIATERWEVVAVRGEGRGSDHRIGTDGVLLVHDKVRGEWRSIFDLGVRVYGLEGDTLWIGTNTSSLKVDLGTLTPTSGR